MSDEELIKRICGGKSEEYGEVIKRYEKKLGRYIQRVVNRKDEVEDILAEVFLSAYKNIKGFDTKRKFGSWIYRIAHNKAVDFIKKQRNITISDEEIDDFWENLKSEDKLAEELAIDEEQKKEIEAAIEKLETKYREVIWLFFEEEKSYEEIADVLHTSVSNVGVMLKRAKEKLKRDLRSKI